jgi:GT2 family glycosyltransferase
MINLKDFMGESSILLILPSIISKGLKFHVPIRKEPFKITPRITYTELFAFPVPCPGLSAEGMGHPGHQVNRRNVSYGLEKCMTASPRVSIIILNWNGWQDTIECLESVYQVDYPNYDVIVADNGSEDESIAKIMDYADGKLGVISKFFTFSDKNKPLSYIKFSRKQTEACGAGVEEIAHLPSWKKLIIIENGENLGFAEGNNIAIRYAQKELNPEYVLLLNNDTIVERTFLRELVEVAESDRKIGFVGPKTYFYDYRGRTDVINFAGGTLVMWKGKAIRIGNKETDHGQHDKTHAVDYIEGSCLLARRETLEIIGLLDPVYFLYWEETDWGMRARKAGFYLVYASKSRIWHKIGASDQGRFHRYFFTRNRFIFTRRYTNKSQFFLFLLYFFGYNVWITSGVCLICHRNINEWEAFIRGIKDFNKIR